MVDINKETVNDLYHGSVDVSTTPTLLADFLSDAYKGVIIRAPSSQDPLPNSACVWVGGPSMTPGTGAATDGMGVAPGESLTIPIADLSKIYVVAAITGQRVQWLAI